MRWFSGLRGCAVVRDLELTAQQVWPYDTLLRDGRPLCQVLEIYRSRGFVVLRLSIGYALDLRSNQMVSVRREF